MGNLGKPDTLERRQRKVFEVIRSEQWETSDTSTSRVRRFDIERKDEVYNEPRKLDR